MPQLTNDFGRLNNRACARFPTRRFWFVQTGLTGRFGPFCTFRFRLIESGLLMRVSKQMPRRSSLPHIAVILPGFWPGSMDNYMPILWWTVPAIFGIIDARNGAGRECAV